MCSIDPTTRRMRRDGKRGATNPGEFFEMLTPTQREAIMPGWAKDVREAGMPWERLMRGDGQWLTSRKAVREAMGPERFDALQAVGGALRTPQWATQDVSRSGGKWRRSEALLTPHAEVPEVGTFLARVRATDGVGTDARELHYLLRRYVNGEPLRRPSDLDAYLNAVLQDAEATVEPHGPRYRIYSARLRRVAILEANGRRVTAFPRDDALILPEAPWTIADLTT